MSLARRSPDDGAIRPRTTPAGRAGHTNLARLVGALGLVAITTLLFWLLSDEAFTVSAEHVTFRGLVNADEAEVRALLGDIDRGPNVFRVRASEIVQELSTLPEVDRASAVVTLPADVTVTLDERDPVFVWTDGAVSWLVDEAGMLFAPIDIDTAADTGAATTEGTADETSGTADEGIATPAEDGSDGADADRRALEARAGLPLVEDARLPEEAPAEGDHLSSLDLAAMRQLLAVDAELLGSRSSHLRLRVDDDDGYVLESEDLSWRALFGTYTLTVRPPDIIPAQVQCLQWLLAKKESQLAQVRLAVTDEACGTFTQLAGDDEGDG